MPSEGIPARRPKKIEKTTIVITGWSTAQAAPRMVCAYRTFISLQARNPTSSRCSHSSRRPSARHPRGGSMRRTGASSAGIEGASVTAPVRYHPNRSILGGSARLTGPSDGRDASAADHLLLARPKFTRGHGFGNRLFPWARARVFAATHGATSVATPWTRLAVGPLLRGGLALRHYRTQILLLGILRAAPGDLSARIALRLARRGTVVREPSDPRAPWEPPANARGPVVVEFEGYRDFFAPLLGHEAELLADLRAIARPRWLALADGWGAV